MNEPNELQMETEASRPGADERPVADPPAPEIDAHHASLDFQEPPMHAPAERVQQAMSVSADAGAGSDPMQLLVAGLNAGVSPERFDQLLTLKERWDANEARKAFANDMARFKADPPKVVKDAYNNQYDSWYTSIGNLVGSINAELGRAGFTARWEYEQQGKGIKVTCILTHHMGHTESATLFGPHDESGKKNMLQQVKSTTTYLRSATFEAVVGIATNDHGADDDGNGAGAQRPAPARQSGRSQRNNGPKPATSGAATINEQQEMELTALLEESDALTRNGFLLKLRRLTADNRPPASIADIPACIFDEAKQIATQGR